MKANEAPEKIYLIRNILTSTSLNTTNDCHEKYLQEWYKGREKDTDIEYTRTDVFIEKFENWVYDKFRWFAEEFNEGIMAEFNDIDTAIEDFKKYIEGE